MGIDPRITKQAEIIVNYSVKVKKGERVTIVSEYEGRPLVKEIYRLLVQKGVSGLNWNLIDEDLDVIYYKYSSKNQRQFFPKVGYYDIKNTDCFIRIYAPSNVKSMSEVDPTKISERLKTLKPISDWRVNKTRWVITLFPTNSLAQEAGMSLSDYEDFVFSAVNDVSWDSLKEKQAKLKKLMDKTKLVKIVSKDTNLSFSIEGRKAESCYGEFNMPDGEVFTSVVENSVNGFVTFSFPAIYLGREFENVRLEFKNGKVVKATSSKNEKDLNKILDSDRGARFIGEFGIGTNYKIKRFTKDILFDEKIGGTIHLALGRGYKETLSKNVSSIHWDMICDLRTGGALSFDDKIVQLKGKWKI
ncbi:aminopeptidase [Patescibacteria group bacterium]|nr:aminopeptidase [Patescibacteria group bacterium]MBU2036376.1 aminopeptidase [Patescibacteria group bacterium]